MHLKTGSRRARRDYFERIERFIQHSINEWRSGVSKLTHQLAFRLKGGIVSITIAARTITSRSRYKPAELSDKQRQKIASLWESIHKKFGLICRDFEDHTTRITRTFSIPLSS